MEKKLPGPFRRFLEDLKSSHLAMVAAGIFLVDLIVPDPLPFVDEAVFALVTILLARWTGRRVEPQDDPEAPRKPPPKNVTPPRGDAD